MALSRQPLTQTGINASPLEMGAVQGKRTVFSTRLCIGGQQWPTPSQPRHFQSEAQRQPCCLHPSGAPTHLPDAVKHCTVNQYANDTPIYVSDVDLTEVGRKLEEDLIRIAEWIDCNNLRMNVSKTQLMVPCRKGKQDVKSVKVHVD